MNGHIKGYVNGVLEGDFIGVIDGEMGAVVRPKDTVTMEEQDDAPENPRLEAQELPEDETAGQQPEQIQKLRIRKLRIKKKQQKAREQKMNSKRLLCFLLGAALILQTPATAYAAETLTYEQYRGGSGYSSTIKEQDYAVIEISTEEDLRKLVENCVLDSWSRDKK